MQRYAKKLTNSYMPYPEFLTIWIINKLNRRCASSFITIQLLSFDLMFYDRQTNNRINRIHEKPLRLAYDDYESNFQSLLEKDNSMSIHDKNLQLFLTEIYKTIHNLNPRFMKEIFTERNSGYNLRNISQISLSKPNTNSFLME